MMRIKRWLAPPVFPDDEQKTRCASLLDMALLVTIALAIILLVGNLLGRRTPIIVIGADIAAIALGLMLRYLAHHGQVRWASIVFIAVDLIGTTVLCGDLGTIRTPTTGFYLLIVVGAGLLFDVPGIIVTTLLSSLAILGLIVAENAGWLPQPDYTVTITQWIAYTALVGLAGGLTWMALQSTRQALRGSDKEIEVRKFAEEKLKASEQYARSIIDSSLDMFVTTDNERRIVEFNRAAQETFGYSREEVIGKHIEMLYAEPQGSHSIRDSMLKQGKFIGEIFNKRKNGEVFPSLLSASILRDASGQILGTVGVSRDFTERKQAEEARQQAEEKYRIIFDSAVEGIFQSTEEGRFITANPALAQMWGYAFPHELITSITDIAHQVFVDPKRRAEFRQLTNEKGRVQGFEYQARRKDGSTMWVSENAHAVQNDKGECLYFEGTIEDITTRKEAEQARLKFELGIERTGEAIFLTDIDGMITYVNPAFERIYGYSSEETFGKTPRILKSGLLSQETYEHFWNELLAKRSVDGEIINKAKNGEFLEIESSANPILNDAGEIIGFLCIQRDITKRKRAEEELRESEERFSGAFDLAAIGMALVSPEGRWLKVNRALCDLTGYSESELLSKTFQDITHPDDLEIDLAHVRQMLAGEIRTYQMEKRYFHKSGQVVWVLLSVSLVRDSQGNPLHFVAQIQDVTGRKQAEETLHRRADEFAALYDITHDLATQQDLASLLQTIVDRAAALVAAPGGGIYLYNAERGDLSLVAPKGNELISGLRLRLGEGLAGLVAQTQQPILVDDYRQWEHRSPQYEGIPITAVVQVPMLYGGDLIGVLAVHEILTTNRKFTDADVRLLSLLAGQAAGAVHNAQLLAETQRRADEFSVLYEITHDLTTKQDLPTLLQTIVDRATKLFNAPGAFVYLYDPVQRNMELRLIKGSAVPLGTRLELGEGMAGRVAQSKQPLIIDDYQTWEHRSKQYEGLPYRATLEVPMHYRGEFIGVVAVYEIGSSERKYTEADARLLALFAGQAAGAVYNTRLFEQAKERAEEFAALYETAHALSTQQDVPALLQTIVERAMTLLHAPSGFIYVYDDARSELELTVSKGLEFPIGTRLKLGEGMAGQVALVQAPLIVDDYQTWEGRATKIATAPYRAIVEVPMQIGGKLIGVLGVNEFGESTRTFAEPDARLLSLFAAQAASALRSAGLLAETRRYANQFALLYEAGLMLNGVLNPTAQLPVFGEIAMKALHSDRVDLFRLDAERNELHCAFSVGYAESRTQESLRQIVLPMGAERGLVGFVAEQRKILNLRDVRAEPRWMVIDPEIRSALWAPVEHGNQLLGVLSILSTRLNAFTVEDERLLELFANEAAIAMENARLFESAERQLKQLSTLREIDRTLNSILDLTPVLETMLISLEQIVPYESAVILLLKEKSLHAVAARGREQDALKKFALDISENAVFEEMMSTLTPMVIDDLREAANWAVIPGIEFARSWLGAPLVARGKLIGQIGLFGWIPNAFTREHADLALAFANQAAVAIANAKLREELSEQARRDSLTQLLNHGTFIHELQMAIEGSKNKAEPLSLIMFDLDHFKGYNDTYGHVVGDKILRATVQAIRLHVKQTDLVGRWGGEEFVVALPGADSERAEQVAVRIRATLAKVRLTDDHGRPIPAPTASQGIATYPEITKIVDELIAKADRALYRAKTRGRDQIVQASDGI